MTLNDVNVCGGREQACTGVFMATLNKPRQMTSIKPARHKTRNGWPCQTRVLHACSGPAQAGTGVLTAKFDKPSPMTYIKPDRNVWLHAEF